METMYPILLLILVGIGAYAVVQHGVPRLEAPPGASGGESVRVDDGWLIVSNGNTERRFEIEDVDYIALRSSGGRRPYRLVLQFGDDRLEFAEDQTGVEALVDYLLHRPPPGTDFTRFGEAMEARRRKLFVFQDRRHEM